MPDHSWMKQGIQLPRDLAKTFKAAGAEEQGGLKHLAAASVALGLGLPKHVRDALMDWVSIMARRDPSKITPADAWRIVEAAHQKGDSTSFDTEWYLDRLRDPSVGNDEPPPSKRPKGKRKAG